MKPSAKTVMITGANRGLGLALAKQFAVQGYGLLLHCRSDWLDLASQFSKAVVVDGDLKDQEVIEQIALAADKIAIDILINNAGTYLSKPFDQMSKIEIVDIINTNLLAPILLAKAIWPTLAKKKAGLIINICSLAGQCGAPGESIYSASKAGLAAFSETLQFDAVANNIKIVNINFGAMKTRMANGRKDSDKLIESDDAARVIYDLCRNYGSLRITSVDIKRRAY